MLSGSMKYCYSSGSEDLFKMTMSFGEISWRKGTIIYSIVFWMGRSLEVQTQLQFGRKISIQWVGIPSRELIGLWIMFRLGIEMVLWFCFGTLGGLGELCYEKSFLCCFKLPTWKRPLLRIMVFGWMESGSGDLWRLI